MTPNEPILTDEDLELWAIWRRAALAHARLRSHQSRVAQAIETARRGWKKANGRLAMMWSGGKDSTAMTHLVCIEAGINAKVVSEKDDLDFPGEEYYITTLAAQWGIDLEIIRPDEPLERWVAEHCDVLDGLRSRRDALSKQFFYPLVEDVNRRYGGVFLGLRAAESRSRDQNFRFNGDSYVKRDGIFVCTPIVRWSGMDVMAYLAARGIEPLPLYKCISFDPKHRDEPWRIRKSWWLPGEYATSGATAWLRRYYPCHYERLCSMWPNASMWS